MIKTLNTNTKINASCQNLKPICYPYLGEKSWNTINMATTAMASTKTNMIAMPMKTFGAADGLRLNAFITA